MGKPGVMLRAFLIGYFNGLRSRRWAGGTLLWEKLEARKMLENAAESHTVRGTACRAGFAKYCDADYLPSSQQSRSLSLKLRDRIKYTRTDAIQELL